MIPESSFMRLRSAATAFAFALLAGLLAMQNVDAQSRKKRTASS